MENMQKKKKSTSMNQNGCFDAFYIGGLPIKLFDSCILSHKTHYCNSYL